MSTKIDKINGVNHSTSFTLTPESVVDLNSRMSGISKIAERDDSDGPGIDWNKKVMETMIMQFAHAMYDPESEIYIGERDIF
ncbi:hypothetical protein D8Z79_015405 [Escherichia fergusonii]|uniref:hypothetical protein n=1 Tax=Escherichia fergusonii TaxID=564 RepID=UPI000F670D5F|nr:hypothetical protein [Escherichia fergusonii]QCZ33108.1 hypothetical protein D8Z79_015405 [Escherichia fergusonii]